MTSNTTRNRLARVVFCVLISAFFRQSVANDDASKISLRWYAPILSPGGYSSEAMTFGLAVQEYLPQLGAFGMLHHGDTASQKHVENNLHSNETELLNNFLLRYDAPDDDDISTRIVICHSEPGAWHAPNPRYHTQRCPPRSHRLCALLTWGGLCLRLTPFQVAGSLA